jgi:hypothetical protein
MHEQYKKDDEIPGKLYARVGYVPKSPPDAIL